MALITCPDCGKRISSMAEACPDCGYPVKLLINNAETGNNNNIDRADLIEQIADALQYNSSAGEPNYDDALDMLKNDNKLAILLAYKHLDIVKDKEITISFGNYNDCTEWIPLATGNKKILIISKYVVCEKCAFSDEVFEEDEIIYDENGDYIGEYITWENSNYREWLNSEYLSKAFSIDEQSLILQTNISSFDLEGGNNTLDRIFLLSVDEATKYFESDSDRQGTFKDGSVTAWVLRDNTHAIEIPFPDRFSAVSMGQRYSVDGEIWYKGSGEIEDNYTGFEDETGMRPAMWLDISSLL